MSHPFDAFIELAERAASPNPAETKKPSPRFMGLLRADIEALRRGTVEGDEICEIAGLGPIPVSVARELLGDAVLKLVITKGIDVANVTHLGWSPTVAQQVALWWQAPMCTAEGCTRTWRLENDHELGWKETQPGSTRSTRSAPTNTTSRPTTAGRSSKAPANGPSSRPTIPATPISSPTR